MHHLVAGDNFNSFAHFVGETLEACEHLAAWWLIGLVHREWKLDAPDTQAQARHLAGLFEQGRHHEMLKWFEEQGQLMFTSHQAATFHQPGDVQRFLPTQYWLRPREAVRSLLQAGYTLHPVKLVDERQVEVHLQVPALSLQAAEELALKSMAGAGSWQLASSRNWYRVDFVVFRTDHHDAEVWVQAASPEEATHQASMQLGTGHLTGRCVPGDWDFKGECTAVSVLEDKVARPVFTPPPLPQSGPWLLTYTHQNHLHGPLCFEDRLEALEHLRGWVFGLLGGVPEHLQQLQTCSPEEIDERLLGGVELSAPWSHSLVPLQRLMDH